MNKLPKGEANFNQLFLQYVKNARYTKNNCVAACKDCNIVKRTLSKTKFLNLIKRIYKHRVNK